MVLKITRIQSASSPEEIVFLVRKKHYSLQEVMMRFIQAVDRTDFLSVYRRVNPCEMQRENEKSLYTTSRMRVINKLFACSPNTPSGLLRQETDTAFMT